MDALIENLQTHEMNKNQETLKKEVKRNKSLTLKVTSSEVSEEDEDMAYLTRRFQKIVRKHGGFRKTGSSSRVANVNDLCHKCGKPGHFIRDCPMHKLKYKDYFKAGGDKDKRRDLDVFDAMFAFMAKSDDEEVEEHVTLSDLKQNLHVYSIKRLRSLATVLIDSITKLTSEKDLMNHY
ncbi:uncharacterized protein [Solanum tuberosum]|uniref:uncharacterized protein n=1 Tax=Solanum tuberosum TaxID=4113 RepID=UPI00073A4329|nr:PREDICTED: uncharacterized protein LOC107059643 [Solanum tuberosum]